MFQSLPRELIQTIFSQVADDRNKAKVKDLVSLAKTCKLFKPCSDALLFDEAMLNDSNGEVKFYVAVYPILDLQKLETPRNWQHIADDIKPMAYHIYRSPEQLFSSNPKAKGCYKVSLSVKELKADPGFYIFAKGMYAYSKGFKPEQVISYLQRKDGNDFNEHYNPLNNKIASPQASP